MPRPTTDREAATEQLLEAAEELIRLRGAHDLSVTEVATACGMSQSNFYRFFESKEAFNEAMAERWFREMNEAMEAVVAADLPPPEKMYRFFECRLSVKRKRFEEDPALFLAYLALGAENREVVQSYIDLADHYLCVIIGEALVEGHFAGRSIDEVQPLVCLMVVPFCDPDVIVKYTAYATPMNLRTVIDTIFAGLATREEPRQAQPTLRLAS